MRAVQQHVLPDLCGWALRRESRILVVLLRGSWDGSYRCGAWEREASDLRIYGILLDRLELNLKPLAKL